MIDTRNTTCVIRERELMHLSASEVYKAYENRASYKLGQTYRADDDIDDATDLALFNRNEPLIHLAIAKYGTNKEIVTQIFNGDDPVLRLALLSHHYCSGYSPGFPLYLFTDRSFSEYFNTCPDDEFFALLNNPYLSRDFLQELFDVDGLWPQLSKVTQLRLIHSITSHPILDEVYDDTFLDGSREYHFSKLHICLWQLFEQVEVDQEFTYALWFLSDRLISAPKAPMGSGPKKEAALRWVARTEAEKEEEHKEHSKRNTLSAFAQIRKNLALVNHMVDEQSKDSPDVAMRCAYYESQVYTKEQMGAAIARDPGLAFESLVKNLSLWRNQELRDALSSCAWKVPDPSHYMDAPNQFRAQEARYRKKYPAWFADDETPVIEAEDADKPLSVEQFNYCWQTLGARLDSVQRDLAQSNKLLKRLFWCVVIVGVLVLAKGS